MTVLVTVLWALLVVGNTGFGPHGPVPIHGPIAHGHHNKGGMHVMDGDGGGPA